MGNIVENPRKHTEKIMTVKNFKKHAKKIMDDAELEEVDDLCFNWLKSSLSNYGKTGIRAVILLDIVQEILEDF